jgi:hypothetical protein
LASAFTSALAFLASASTTALVLVASAALTFLSALALAAAFQPLLLGGSFLAALASALAFFFSAVGGGLGGLGVALASAFISTLAEADGHGRASVGRRERSSGEEGGSQEGEQFGHVVSKVGVSERALPVSAAHLQRDSYCWG